jgi:hypothetical protein
MCFEQLPLSVPNKQHDMSQICLPRAMSEKKAPDQSMARKTQLIPITLPLRFHSSPYGGRSPAARRIAAIIPMTIIGISFPLSYIG